MYTPQAFVMIIQVTLPASPVPTEADSKETSETPNGTNAVTLPASPVPTEADSKETSESSNGTNAAAIAVPVTLLFIALVIALGYLLHRRRKR